MTDLDDNQTFDDGDVLIRKLLDSNGDGTPSAGDTIVMGKFPKERDPSAGDFEDWGVKRHLVTGGAATGSNWVSVSAGDAQFRYTRKTAGSSDSHIELDGGSLTYIRDESDVGGDALLIIDPLSPSRPSKAISESGIADEELIDVILDV